MADLLFQLNGSSAISVYGYWFGESSAIQLFWTGTVESYLVLVPVAIYPGKYKTLCGVIAAH